MSEEWDLGYSAGWRAAMREMRRKTASKVVSSGYDTEGATGHTECSECHEAIDYWDAYCRHCGASLEG